MRSLRDPDRLLAEGLAAIRTQFKVPEQFPDAVEAAAQAAIARRPGEHADRTDRPFVTLDPASSTDLDQAFAIEPAGADLLLICTNTMHRMAGEVEAAIAVPLLHIADATADAVRAAGHGKVGLLGTAFTMEQDFYKARLAERHGLEVLVPEAQDRALVHQVIYEELVAGIVRAESRAAYREVIARLVARGAQAVILGCTEIMLLVGESDSTVPLFDTTGLHAAAAVQAALEA